MQMGHIVGICITLYYFKPRSMVYDRANAECRKGTVLLNRIEERHMLASRDSSGQHHAPKSRAVSGAVRQLERPRSRSVPCGVRCFA